MSRRTLIAIIAGAIVVLILVVAITWNVARRATVAQYTSGSPTSNVEEEQSKTKLPVPNGLTVPEVTSKTDANVAAPKQVLSQPGGFAFRSFDIQVSGDKFIPDTIIVRAADDVYINFLAVDKDYDFRQPDNGFAGSLPKGQQKVLHGQFPSVGKFILYCEKCGGPDKGPIMYITVIPK